MFVKTIRVWLVEGRTGEYDDRSNWNVAACVTEEAGKKLVLKCREWAQENGLYRLDDRDISIFNSSEIIAAIRSGVLPDAPDQNMNCDYNCVLYDMFPLDLRIHDDQEFEEFADALIACRAGKL